jgi:hypothetical protein
VVDWNRGIEMVGEKTGFESGMRRFVVVPNGGHPGQNLRKTLFFPQQILPAISECKRSAKNIEKIIVRKNVCVMEIGK